MEHRRITVHGNGGETLEELTEAAILIRRALRIHAGVEAIIEVSHNSTIFTPRPWIEHPAAKAPDEWDLDIQGR